MPDGSLECQRIFAQLDEIQERQQEIREMHISHAATVTSEIRFIKDKIDTIETSTYELSKAAAHKDGLFDGAVWALAKVGAFAMLLLAGVGWLTTGGGWVWIKEHL